MARIKGSRQPKSKRMMTWTRFRLPPNQEWPAWPCLGSCAESNVNPLEGVGGTSRNSVILGKMVESAQEAVCMVSWEYMDDLTNFLASPACDDFLRLLDGHEYNAEDTARETQTEPADSTSPPPGATQTQTHTDPEIAISRRRRRFLILKHWEEAATSNIQGRVTLSTFVIPAEKEDGYSSMFTAYPDMRDTFGRDWPKEPDYESIEKHGRSRGLGRVWFWAKRVAPAEEEKEDLSGEWMEKTFGREGGGGVTTMKLEQGGPSSQSASGPKALICEFRIWNERSLKNSGHLEKEEANATDPDVKEKWDRFVGKWMSDGRILAWRRERWDFEPVFQFEERNRDKVDKERYEDEGEAMEMDA